MGFKLYIFLISAFLLCSFGLISQDIVLYNGHEVVDKTIIIKIRPQGQLKSTAVRPIIPHEITAINQLIQFTGFSQLHPFSKKPDCKECVDLTTIYEITYSADYSLETVITLFNKLESVEYAEPRFIHYSQNSELPSPNDTTINDPFFNSQYELKITEAYKAWAKEKGSSSIIIGITDTGFELAHEDLVDKIAYNNEDPINNKDDDYDGYIDNFRGWDVGVNDNNPSAENDDGHHGTMVAGFAAAENNNSKGIGSPAFNCKFLPIKITNTSNYIMKGFEGIVYAADHGCQIINCSWGNTYKSQYGFDIIKYATFNHDALIIAATGNSGNNVSLYPASYDYVISVSGTDNKDQKWGSNTGGSSFGNYVDIAAPSTNMRTTGKGNSYVTAYGGTSFGAPLVAAAAGLIRSHFPHFNAIETGELLKTTADNIDTVAANKDYYKQLGFGRLNCYRALTDTNRAALYIEDITVTDNNDDIFVPGDTLVFSGNIHNYLKVAENISITTEMISYYSRSFKTNHIVDKVETKSTRSEENIFSVIIPPVLPLDFDIEIRINIKADNYDGYQYYTLRVNKSHETIVTENASIRFFSNGIIGNHNSEGYTDNSITYKGETTLYDAGIIIGTSSNNLLSAVRDNKDFAVKKRLTKTENEFVDQSYQAVFTDTIMPFVDYIGINITQNIYVINNEDSYIVEYGISNTSNLEISNLKIGLFADWEVKHEYLNDVVFQEKDKIVHTFSNEPLSHYCSISLLEDYDANHFAIDIRNTDLRDIEINDGFDQEEKYKVLTQSRQQQSANILGSDVATVLSTKIKSIEPSDTAWVAFAIILSDSQNQSLTRNKNAATIYKKINGTYQEPTTATTTEKERLYIYYGDEEIKLHNTSIETWRSNITFYNAQGKVALSYKDVEIGIGSNNINTEDLMPSLYYMHMYDKNKQLKVFKIVINE